MHSVRGQNNSLLGNMHNVQLGWMSNYAKD